MIRGRDISSIHVVIKNMQKFKCLGLTLCKLKMLKLVFKVWFDKTLAEWFSIA